MFNALREIALPQRKPGEDAPQTNGVSRQRPGGTQQTPTRSRRTPSNNYGKSLRNPVREASGEAKIGSGTLPERARAKKTQQINFRPRQGVVVVFAGIGFWRFWGSGREPKIDQTRPWGQKSVSGDGSGIDFWPILAAKPARIDFCGDFGTNSLDISMRICNAFEAQKHRKS